MNNGQQILRRQFVINLRLTRVQVNNRVIDCRILLGKQFQRSNEMPSD